MEQGNILEIEGKYQRLYMIKEGIVSVEINRKEIPLVKHQFFGMFHMLKDARPIRIEAEKNSVLYEFCPWKLHVLFEENPLIRCRFYRFLNCDFMAQLEQLLV